MNGRTGRAVALAVGVGLAGCGGRPDAKPTPVASPAIKLGMSAALTGPAQELGLQMKLGIELSLAAVNAQGGIAGRTFQLAALDDGYEPDRAKETMTKLVESEKVFAIIGNVGTPTALVAVPYALERKVLFFGAFTGAGILRKNPPDHYVFNYRASYAEETAAVVRYLVEKRKLRPDEIAVFAQEDGFGDSGFDGVAGALLKYGTPREKVLRVGFQRNTLDVEEAVKKIVAARKKLRAVCTVAPYQPATKFIRLVRDAGLDVAITNVSFVGSTALARELSKLGPKYARGIVVTQVVPPVDSQAAAVARYRDLLARQHPGTEPDFVSLEGYLASSILMEGFRRAGPNPTTESVISALESIHGFDLGIPASIGYGPLEHQACHRVWGTFLDENARYEALNLD
jgi:ABC-type branched-subunit amino acid transport system substrate-binding protein